MGNQITNISDIEIYVNNTAIPKTNITVVDGNFTVSIVKDKLTIEEDSITFTVNATYKGNATVNAINSSSLDYVVNKIPSVTNITILNSTYGNVTIRVNVTDARDPSKFAYDGSIYVYDFISGSKKLLYYPPTGNIDIKLDDVTNNLLKLLVQYSGTEVYLNSTARNESAFGLDKDVIRIDVQKAPSTTNIEQVLSNKSGNVTLAINVTNATNDLISTGHVIIVNATDGTVLGEGDLVNGKVNITLTSVVEPGDIVVNVTYQGNNLYLPSNITAYTITVTVDPTINITLSDDDVIIGEAVTITGTALNTTGQPYTTGHVNVTVDGVNITGVTYDTTTGEYTVTYIPSYEGVLTVNASYINDNDEIIVISENKTLTVNKIPTITNVEVLNNTYSNVTIRVNVTTQDNPDVALKEGNITVYDINGNLLASEKVLTDQGYVDIKLNNVTKTGMLYYNVTYNGNDKYLPSHAINETTGSTYLPVDVTKMPTITNIEAVLNNSIQNVTITVNVTNATGESLTGGRIEVRNVTTGELIGEGTLNSDGKV
ncbi:MAG: hypothetical protein BZ135_02635, partial [Methanosphaera sp. rholeuAM6]